MVNSVAIIGAGASGLTAIKCCLDEGITPTCFERTNAIGGLWNFTEEVREKQACVMRSTVINTSKEMMCYSDFPIPQDYPIFMHNKYVQKYFNLYAENFNLKKYIKFGYEINSVKPKSGLPGPWQLTGRNLTHGETFTQTFDAVLVCTGHHAEKKMPNFPGLDNFKGRIIHTHDYKDDEGYKDKKVVIVGIGNSGGDCAVELSRKASQVYLSTRRGSWIFNRVSENGLPADMIGNKKFLFLIRKLIGDRPLDLVTQLKLNSRFDHEVFSLKPQHGIFSEHPTINDDLPNRIICGSVIIKPNIKTVTERGVEFDDGTTVEGVDILVFATGYIFGFPFLDESIVKVQDNQVELYKWMFPPSLAGNSLAIIGCVQPWGAVMPISELQCRLAVRVFKGDVSLPSVESMSNDILKKRDDMSKRYVQSTRHTIQVEYVLYMDELAELNNCRPKLARMLLTDPKLAVTCFFGPCTPYQYRLQGPGKWPGARKAIMTQWDRTVFPLKTRPMETKTEKLQIKVFFFFLFFTIIFSYIIHILFAKNNV